MNKVIRRYFQVARYRTPNPCSPVRTTVARLSAPKRRAVDCQEAEEAPLCSFLTLSGWDQNRVDTVAEWGVLIDLLLPALVVSRANSLRDSRRESVWNEESTLN